MLEKLLSKKSHLKVLVPINPSSLPRTIDPTFLQLVKTFKAEIVFFSVISTFWKRPFAKNNSKNDILKKISAWAEQHLSKNMFYKVHVDTGNARDKIIKFSQKHKSNLIYFGIEKFVQDLDKQSSALTDQVIRYSNTSVWISKQKKLSKILCAVDGSSSSQQALKVAIQLCKLFSCKLTILNIFPAIDFNPVGLDEHIVRKFNKEFEQKCKTQMESFLKKFDYQNVKVNRVYLRGSPASTILDFSEENKMNLIVMGAKGQSVLHDFFVGSTVERVMPFVQCSLMIVR